ncbi:MAG: hypothetical protein MJ252_20625 [archaeon]|nr:hypothetical protein [archaeon]
MGCCGSAGQKNPEIERAPDAKNLSKVFQSIIESNKKEIEDITKHLTKNTPLETTNLKGFDKEDLKKRATYLTELNDSYKNIVGALDQVNDVRQT